MKRSAGFVRRRTVELADKSLKRETKAQFALF
jgi:hypothetical protein